MGNTQPGGNVISITDAGHQEDPKTCPEGTVMTGIRWKTGRGHIPNSPAINGISGFWCKDTHMMDLPNRDSNQTFVDTKWGDTGGTSRDARCESNAALRGGQFWFEQDDKIGGAKMYCAPFGKKNPHISSLPVVGVKTDTNRTWGRPFQYKKGDKTNDIFMTGLGAKTRHKKGKRMIWELELKNKDFKTVREILNDNDKQSKCCSGENTDTTVCGKFKPDSSYCINVMNEYCAKDDNIASDKCQNMCRKNKSVECDNNMIAYCKRQKEKGESPELCNCINSKSLAPQCWDPKCTATSAYMTLNQENRDDCGVFCNQEISVIEPGGEVGIDKVKFKQACGAEKAQELEDAINPPPPEEEEEEPEPDEDDEPDDVVPENDDEEQPDEETEEEQPEKEGNGNDYTWIYVTLIIIVALIIILALGLTGLWFLLF